MERVAFGIYLLVLIISPLQFGAVHAYAYSLVFTMILTASLLLAVHNIRRDSRTGRFYFQYPQTGLNFLFFSFFVFLILQILPLPTFLVGFLSPRVLEVKSGVTALTGKGQTFAMAPYVYPVRMSLMRWTVYGLFFIGLSQVLNSRRRIEILCFCILATACFISVYGIYQAYAGDHSIWWFVGYGRDVRGTYINRNHFAGMMAMALMLAAAYASSHRSSFFLKKNESSSPMGNREKLLSSEQSYSKRTLIIFCGVVIGLGLVLSASRGGIISAAFGLLLMGLLFVYRESQRRNGLIVLLIFLLVGGYGLQVGLEHTFVRFQPDQLQSSFEGRFRYAQKTIDVFNDYKIAGAGAGNFQYVYPRYQAVDDMGLLIDYAHNDWAQLLAEMGLAGLILTITGIGLFVFIVVRRWKERKDHKATALGVVPLAVLTTIGLHSWFDFNMHIPANVLILGAVMAIGQAVLFIRQRRSGKRFELGFRRINYGTGGFFLVVVLFLVIGWNMTWTLRHFAAEAYCNTVPNSTFRRDRNPAAAEIMKAISWDRYNAEYWYKLAQALRRERFGQAGYLDDMTDALEKALLLNPFAALSYLELGWAYTQRWQEEDFTEKWLPKADQAMTLAGVYSGARDPGLHHDLGNYWLKRSKTLEPESMSWPAALERAGNNYQQALDLEKGEKRKDLLEDIRTMVGEYYPDPEIFEKMELEEKSTEEIDEEAGGNSEE